MPHPLAGLRVLDLSRVLSGPFVGRMLADLGADVVKVEPPEGDLSRSWGVRRHGLGGYYTQQNAGKRNVCIDLRAPGGSALLARLADVTDILVENFRPGVLARYGLDYASLAGRNPRLLMLSISGFGQAGPEAQRGAYAPVIHAESGVLVRQAWVDGDAATDLALSVADTNAGLHGLVGLLAALHLRERTGRGQHIDVAMLDAMLATDDRAYHALDGGPPPGRMGEIFDAPGGPILVAGHLSTTWRVLSTRLGVSDPATPGAPLPEKVRLRRAAAQEFFHSFADRASLAAVLHGAGIFFGDVRSPEAAYERPGAADRGLVAQLDDRGGGTRPVVQSPYRFSDAQSGARGGAPYRGEHNAEVLAEWIGVTANEVEELLRDGTLAAEPAPGERASRGG